MIHAVSNRLADIQPLRKAINEAIRTVNPAQRRKVGIAAAVTPTSGNLLLTEKASLAGCDRLCGTPGRASRFACRPRCLSAED